MTVEQFKKEYPQYSNLHGQQLWDKMYKELHSSGYKFTSDGIKDNFHQFTLTQRKGMEPRGDFEEPMTGLESLRREEYIRQAQEDDTYGDLYDTKIEIEHDDSLPTRPLNTNKPTESYSFVIWDGNKDKFKPEMKKYEIWIGFVSAWGQGDHDSTSPTKLGEVEATSFKIACCIYEHQSAIDSLKARMERGDTYIEDTWFGKWGYNPEDNSTFYLGKYYETEEEAWSTFNKK